ncbi:chitobiase/beta-hexosaminidase C-terminal domain-containing protein, partial [Bacillus horti]
MKNWYTKIAVILIATLLCSGWLNILLTDQNVVYARDVHWETVGTAGFSEGAVVAEGSLITTVSIDVHAGVPYVAYADESKDGKLVVQKYNGSAWEYVGNKDGISNTAARGISLVLYDGSPYVAYTGKEELGADKVFVKKYNGAVWVPMGSSAGLVGTTNTTTTSLSVYEGIPYVAFANIAGSVRAFKLNGNEWMTLPISDLSKGSSVSIDVNGGIPYIAYMSSPPLIFRAMVAKLDGSMWESLGQASPPVVGGEKMIMKLDNGTPYVAFFNQQKATVMKYSGSGVDWEPVGAAEFSPNGSYTAFDLNEGIPYLGFMDRSSRRATVMTFDGSEWKTVGMAGFSEGEANNLSLAVDGESAYLAYLDKENGNKVTVMKHDITIPPQVSTLVASPSGGAVAPGTTVELTTETSGATIYYTTDGSEPTRSSAEYTDPIEITEAMTIKAIAVKDGMSDSEVLEEDYTILLQVDKPVASPSGEAVVSGTSVELITETSGATIHYTTDGNQPTRSSTQYSAPIEITAAVTIKAIAVKEGMSDSEVLEEHYTVLPPEQVVAPVADPAGGEYAAGTSVELATATSGAAIYYTTDGREPTRSSTEYTAPIEITEAVTIKAIAVKDGMTDSEMLEEHYTVLPPEQVVAPVADPAGGEYAAGTSVELTTETSGATIYYSTDGSDPTRSSAEYTAPIEITEAMTIKAIAVKDGMRDSEVLEEHYTIATRLGPANLTASAGDRSVTLKWSDATETGTVTYAVYQVEGPSAPADPANWTLVQSNI